MSRSGGCNDLGNLVFDTEGERYQKQGQNGGHFKINTREKKTLKKLCKLGKKAATRRPPWGTMHENRNEN